MEYLILQKIKLGEEVESYKQTLICKEIQQNYKKILLAQFKN